MKTKSEISGYIIRSGAWAVFLSMAFIAVNGAFNSPNKIEKTSAPPRIFTFAERVAYQRAIEEVYWRHRIWPKENPDPKPSLDSVMSQAQLENKVENYLRESVVLGDNWQKPITAEQLQAEVDRMARDTKQPEVLRELFEALGNDPAVIAECLARPALTERLIADLSAQGQTPHVEAPQTDGLRAMSVVTIFGQVDYTLPNVADANDPPCPEDTWTPTTTTNAPSARSNHTALWTGTEMIVWGGGQAAGALLNTGGRYNPSTDSWTAINTTNAPESRYVHTAVWTGSEMIIWGGGNDPHSDHVVDTGGRYNPATNSWSATSTTHAPTARLYHTAVWTGSEMIVWGGANDLYGYFNTGGKYNPHTNSWTATSTTNAPSGRYGHATVWTGSEMIVWGGLDEQENFVNTGARYNPGTNSWTATSRTNAAPGRYYHTAVWTGSEMIVWGGYSLGEAGGRYNPQTDSWTLTTLTNAPIGRLSHTAVWTGKEMIVWGGVNAGTPFTTNAGARYDPITNTWAATSTTNAPSPRGAHSAVWTGNEMIVWGGPDVSTGGRYCAFGLPIVAHQATFIASNSFRANWSSVSGATYRLDVATNSSFTTYVTGYHDLNVGSATSYTVTGLNASTVYYYRVRANNVVVTSGNSNTVSVTTLTPGGAPIVVTNLATNVANSSATLNGSLDPHGLTTTLYFQYGATTNYGRTTPSQTQAGNTYRNINANITGLPANSVYHFRIVATNTAGTRYGADRIFTLVSDDFNNDNHPDYLLFNAITRRTVIWYMNNNVHIGSSDGPMLPAGWGVGGLADFNGDGHPDYLLFNPTTRGTVIWYMNNNIHIGSASGPAIPTGWTLASVADFNGDGPPDYLLFNPTTRGTVIWYMNNNIHIGSSYGPMLLAGWEVAGVADFNTDAHPDYLLFNPVTRGNVIWYMNNNVHIGGIYGPMLPAGWSIVAP